MPAETLAGPDDLRAAVERMGAEISSDHPDGVVLISVLKGSVMFLADLVRAVAVPVEVDFIAISRYAPDSGRVRIVLDLTLDIEGRDVVLVEDVLDTGLSMVTLLAHLNALRPRKVTICTMLDRATRRIVPVPVRYRGFEIEDEFAIGYGLDFAERYRNVPAIVIGNLRDLRADADAHVGELYPPAP